MQAFVYHKYGSPDVLQLTEIEKPSPSENRVLVKIHAVSVNALDWHLMTADIFLVRFMAGGVLKPKQPSIPGVDVAGVVEAVGEGVTRFKVGDAVFGDIAGGGRGGFAEYVAAPEKLLVHKPANLSFEQAAAVPVAAITALQGLRDVGKIQAGQKVLVHGASGGVGTYAVQLAKVFGAEVTAVCSTRNLDQARSLGADHVIDYTKEDFSKNGQQYDLILAANGNRSIYEYKRALSPKGVYVMAGGTLKQIMQSMTLGPLISQKDGKKLGGVSAHQNQKDLETLAEMLEAGKIVPVIDRVYPFKEAPEALGYLGAGHARGKVVVNTTPASHTPPASRGSSPAAYP